MILRGIKGYFNELIALSSRTNINFLFKKKKAYELGKIQDYNLDNL